MSICPLQEAAMNATTDHRSRDDAAFEPQGDGWMYRSEAFAEDVDHLLSAAVAVATAPFVGARREAAALSETRNPARWPAVLAGALFGRAQGAG
jgi:hypothetical protein